MKPINAKAYFQQKKASVDLYLLALETMPTKGGYMVGEDFYDTETFMDNFDQVSEIVDLSLSSLPPDSKLKQVCMGDMIVIESGTCLAEADGFVLALPGGKPKYYSDGIFRSIYQVTAPTRKDGGFLIVEKMAKIYEGIRLTEDTIFAFKKGACKVVEGSFLFVNHDDEDGFSACSCSSSIGTFVKLRPAIYPRANVTWRENPGWDSFVQ